MAASSRARPGLPTIRRYEPRTTAPSPRMISGIIQKRRSRRQSVRGLNRSGLGEFLLVAALREAQGRRRGESLVYLTPPDAAPALPPETATLVEWGPGVDMRGRCIQVHASFSEGRDLEFQIDSPSYLTPANSRPTKSRAGRAVKRRLRARAGGSRRNRRKPNTRAEGGHDSDQVRPVTR